MIACLHEKARVLFPVQLRNGLPLEVILPPVYHPAFLTTWVSYYLVKSRTNGRVSSTEAASKNTVHILNLDLSSPLFSISPRGRTSG